MHRYHTPLGSTNGMGNNNTTSPSGVSRDSVVRADVGFSTPSSLPLTTRRLVPLTPYTLKCEQEALSARLGPPDYFPPTPNCAEESLGRDACQNGYKEIVEGIEESRETGYSLVNLQVWAKPLINKYKEGIWKRLNALNNSLVRKRKAGQVYGVPLSGSLLVKPGHFPEQRHSGEDNRKKWIEDLAQHKRLRVLADHVPHGLRRRPLFESLIKNGVPFLRATWCIKVMYLNQVRPLSTGMSGGAGDKSHTKRVELLTKDVLEYMLFLLDELGQHGVNEISAGERSYLPVNNASPQLNNFTQGSIDSDDPPLQKRWHYMTRLLQLHVLEGLVNRATVIDWVLKQLQERDGLDATELLLPIILDLIDDIATCQTLVRTVVDIFLHKMQVLCPVNVLPDASELPREHYVATFFAELLCYLITVVPDSFLALDCFPLPAYIFHSRKGDKIGLENGKIGALSALTAERASYRQKRTQSCCDEGVKFLADVIQKRATSLAKTVNPGSLRKNEGSVIQCLDKALITGDILSAYRNIFDEEFCGHEQPPDEWLSKVSSWVKISPVLSGNGNPAEVFSVRFLCEWAICDFRDCRKRLHTQLTEHYNTNVQAACKVYMALSVLCLRVEELEEQRSGTYNTTDQEGGARKISTKNSGYCKSICLSSFFDSPGPIHDIIAAWLDQHDLRKGEGFERLQLLLWELVKKGLFWPPAYVRKLIVNGVLEKEETPADVEHASKHVSILQHLPWPPGLSLEEEGRKSFDPSLAEAIRIHRNERRFCLKEFGQPSLFKKEAGVNKKQSHAPTKCVDETIFVEKSSYTMAKARKLQKKKVKLMDLKQAIAKYLRFPESCFGDEAQSLQEKSTLLQTSLKRHLLPQGNMAVKINGTPGCEKCRRSKKQKINDGSSVFTQGYGVSLGDEVDMWWIRKVPKPLDVAKSEPTAVIKPPKLPSRGRPKAVRKLSLAQSDAARIEGSQGASSSHMCNNKVNCPYHKPLVEDSVLSQKKERKKNPLMPDLKSITSMLKHLRLSDKRIIATWLDVTVRNLVGGGDKLSSVSISLQQPGRVTATDTVVPVADERSTLRWQFEEEELSAVLCLLDVANDFSALIKLLLWLLPKVSIPGAVSVGQNYSFSTSKESFCKINESVILTSLRRYEGILLATNLLPEAFSAAMKRAELLMLPGSNSRTSCASLFTYIHDLYKKYGSLQIVQLWEKDWKTCSDQRLVNEVELLLKVGENDSNLPLLGVNSPNVGDDRDESFPPRLMGRLVRFGPHMRDHVRRGFQEVINQMIAREREISVSGILKDTGIERWGEGLQAAQSVAGGLLECIKQQAGSTLNGDIQLAAAAVSSVVSNVGTAVAGVFENLASSSSYSSSGSVASSVKCARRILQAHMQCLRHLKEAFCEKQTKVLESALACEATTVITNSGGHSFNKSPWPQYQLSPEMPDSSFTLNEQGAGSNGFVLERSNTAASAVAALVVCAVLEDVAGLERIISLLKIKEGLENVQISKVSSLGTNGMSRVMSTGNAIKSDSMAEVYLFWFRVLISDCRSISGGLLAELLGESNILALLRIQRLLPLTTVFAPAYSLFSISLRAQQSAFMSISNREDTSFQQLVHAALGDLLAHPPFYEVCLQDTKALADLLHSDTSDADYATFLDNKGADMYKKVSLMVPSRPRLFLHAILDHKLPILPEDESCKRSLKGHGTLTNELVQVLDDIHPATFHWQWVELRFLLNEQVFMDKFEAQNMSVTAETMQAARLAILDKQNLSETEKNLTDMILTRLLVRPDAAALYSEVLHLLGRAFEDYLILQVQWILENGDMVLGRKFLRQQLEEVAHRQKFEVGCGRFRVWEWVLPQTEDNDSVEKNSKTEVASPEEGEVAEEDLNSSKQLKRDGVSGSQRCNMVLKKQFAIEKALADLVLPCLARSSAETYNRFASRLVKQISELEQQVTALSRSNRSVTTSEVGINKRLGSRKGAKTGLDSSSPSLGRRASLVTDPLPPSLAALQTSLWLRLQFLLPLLPPIYIDREQTVRNMRSLLAPVLLRLVGTRVVQESMETFCFSQRDSVPVTGCDLEWNAEASAAAAVVIAGENLFDRILSVLHALLSSTWASWLKQKPSKGSSRPPREVPPFDKEIIHRMQVDLDHMQLPSTVRARLQAAMPILAPSPTPIIAAGPPQIPPGALPMMQMSGLPTNISSTLPSTASYKAPLRMENSLGKAKQSPVQDLDSEIDPWTLIEDIASSSTTGSGGVLVMNESGSSKACAWLKGAVRVRRTNLTYVSSVDDDS